MAISEDKVKAPLFTLLSSARQEEETRQHALESLCNDLCQGSRLHAAPEPGAGGGADAICPTQMRRPSRRSCPWTWTIRSASCASSGDIFMPWSRWDP